jgi:CubicO group peptidase (beta-lactamase class C family)
MSALAGLIVAAGIDDELPVAFAVVDGAGKLAAAASGVWRDGRPVSLEDRFYGASVAKQLTGAAATLLVRDGQLDPDAPVAEYLGGLPAWGNAITARQLLHHTAGLPEAGVAETVLEGNWTEAAVTAYLAGLDTLSYPPGTEHRYSNLGYILLARLVAGISDTPFADFVASRLAGDPAIGFTSDISAFQQAAYLGPAPLTQGDGGLWTTAAALAGWLNHQNRDPLRLAAIVEAPGRLNDGTAVDDGWGVGLREYRGERLLIHGGGWTGATCKTVRCPAFGIVVVTLTAGADMQKVIALTDAALELAYSSASSSVR